MLEPCERAIYAARDLYFKDVAESRRRWAVAPDYIIILEFGFGVAAKHMTYFDQHRLRVFVRYTAYGFSRRRAHGFGFDAAAALRSDRPTRPLASKLALIFQLAARALDYSMPCAGSLVYIF
jgi:hypothetical protein